MPDPKNRVLAVIGAVLALAVLAPLAHAAGEVETHIFDPNLSLTGDCATSPTDNVPDPECPGGVHPSNGGFSLPSGVAVDAYGNRYVASYGPEFANPSEGRIDVFDSEGKYITEIPNVTFPAYIAVDSEGYLYVCLEVSGGNTQIVRYKPMLFEPEEGAIAYPPTAESIAGLEILGGRSPVAVNPENDHLFVNTDSVKEYSSASEGNMFLGKPVSSSELNHNGLAGSLTIDAASRRIWVAAYDGSSLDGATTQVVLKAFELEAPHALVATVEGSATPQGKFSSTSVFQMALAVDETSGHLFAADFQGTKKRVYEFDSEGDYVAALEHSFVPTDRSGLAVDNGSSSATRGYLFVNSGTALGHSYAFEPKPVAKPPLVGSLGLVEVTEDEAVLTAGVNPQAQETAYIFEYTTMKSFESQGFAGAAVAGEGVLDAVNDEIAVSAPATGLEPGTAYRFRVRAHSDGGDGEDEGSFSTYSSPQSFAPCPNDPVRTGLSAELPDCRAYELVTPSNTNGHSPLGLSHLGVNFPSRESSPAGDKVSFQIQGGPIPGFEGAGSLLGDPYLSTRTQAGWQTASAGPDGSEATAVEPGSPSPDQGYSFWRTASLDGPASLNGKPTAYLRYPDGHSEVLGVGSVGTDQFAIGLLISENGGHVVFASKSENGREAQQLEPDAPPSGTEAIYDLTSGGLEVVSLLPGDETPAPGENAEFVGGSLDGRGIAFVIASGAHQGTLYLRRDNSQTHLVEEGMKISENGTGAEFAGVSDGGGRVFLMKQGDLWAFDAATEAKLPFSSSGDVTPVNVSADGTAAYFISPSMLPVDANQEGALPQPGAENLYLSREGQISFVATVSGTDVEAIPGAGGLGDWLAAAQKRAPGRVPARTTADGSVLLFESSADLTGFDSDGHREIYRYEAATGGLLCLSCSPAAAGGSLGDARLQSTSLGNSSPEPLTVNNLLGNLVADGRRVFFESLDPLVVGDVDGQRDVYEWEQEGTGSCQTAGGCLYLISSGRSAEPNYLYAVSDSGNDVFFLTSDLLLPSIDPDESPSIYDARVDGGFPPPAQPVGECLGEACQPQAVAPPKANLGTSAVAGQGNLSRPPRCARGKPKKRGAHCRHHRHKQKRHGAKRRSHR
jgi:hypothetical protein